MQIKPDQLERELRGQLKPVYLVTGDEPLQVQESCDAIRRACREQGISERDILDVDQHFDWSELLSSSANMSLFGDRKLIELRIPNGKPGDKGSKALVQYTDAIDPDNILLIVAGKIEPASKRSKWFSALDRTGAIIFVWPIDERQLPRWLVGRAKQRGLSIAPDALTMICDRVEGNMLAAVQELDKLSLVATNNTIDLELVTQSVSDNARYNLFSTIDAALAGRAADAIRMLAGLRAEGTAPILVLWAIHRELSLLQRCREMVDAGQRVEAAVTANRVWKNRQRLVSDVVSRCDQKTMSHLMSMAVTIDQTIKGMQQGDPWQVLADTLLQLANTPLNLDTPAVC